MNTPGTSPQARRFTQPITTPALAIRPEAAALFVTLLEQYARAQGVPLSPTAAALHRELRDFLRGLDDCGPADVRRPPTPRTSESWIDVSEAARLLGVTVRHASRLAREGLLGPSHVTRGARRVLREEVALMAAERNPS